MEILLIFVLFLSGLYLLGSVSKWHGAIPTLISFSLSILNFVLFGIMLARWLK